MREEAYGDHDYVDEEVRGNEALALVEAEGASLEGCAEQKEGLVLEGLKGTRSALVEETRTDETLHVARGLGERKAEGYRYENGVLMRTRLDRLGQTKEQICLPKGLREQCMALAHTKFGHMGRNKMCSLITPHFYWPSLSKHCKNSTKRCDA